MTWMQRAACRDADPDLFFAEQGEKPTEALAYCRRCPVRAECLQFALHMSGSANWDAGVWGGTTPKQRRRLKRVP